eukprot:TRINITY_DN34356_c0_g1_i1.p1 TRINITY_DN34356_c0_g1~~TRINITY_DN34356_c0_g1_i1.p1  ORF type:complete len:365 (-),score=101.83 TRINITY_DN34356_c0_g1_i1:27-1100(-)
MAAAPVVAADAHCTLQVDAKVKAPLRHVLIKDLGKVATALKASLPLEAPTALFMTFEGEPNAAEHCAKGLHSKLLKRLGKVSSKTASDAELGRVVAGAFADLDSELREQRPGAEGCGGAVALLAGRRLCLAVAGSCGGMLWGSGLKAIAAGTGAVSEIGKDGVLRKSAKETPEQKRAKALMRLRARNPDRQLGGSVVMPGGKRPGSEAVAARGAAAVRAASAAAAMGRGGPAVGSTGLGTEDLLIEVVPLAAGDHSLVLLGSSGLQRSGLTAQDVGALAEACTPDAAKASQVVADLAKERLKEALKGEANWVQQEKAKASEVTCIALLLEWAKEGNGDVSEKTETDPPAKRLRADDA